VTHDEVLERAQDSLGYRFRDPNLLVSALTHASIASTRLDSNERLEFLGDAVLGLVVCEELYRRYDESLEGDLTKIKSVVVSRKVCAQIAERMGLGDLLFLGKGMREREGLPMSLLAAVFESLTAAIYLDGGFETARAFLLSRLLPYIEDTARSENQHNYKSFLQQYAQRTLSATPQYEELDEQGPDHSKCFEVCVRIGPHRFRSAWGRSKKDAEQQAALRALQELRLSDPDANLSDIPLESEDELLGQPEAADVGVENDPGI